MKKISILLVDDHELFRKGIKSLIENESDLEVIGMASNGKEALEKLEKISPDIILLDISMPVMTGIELAKKLKRSMFISKIIFLSLYDRDDYVLQSLEIGVNGFILKDAPNTTFLKAIRKVMTGHFFYSGDLSNILVREVKKNKLLSENNEKSSIIKLSVREAEILKKIKEGSNNKELSDLFNVSIRTIEAHRLNIMRKLGVKQIDLAINVALENHII